MFSVHGLSGQSFHGALENLLRVPGVLPARHARAVGREGDELGAEYRIDADQAEDERRARAAAAYAAMLHKETARDPVRHAWQVMGRQVLTLSATDTVGTAWRTLAARRVRQAPVLGAAGAVVGLVSERDLLTLIDLADGKLSGWLDRTVGEVMTTPVVCADPATDIRRVALALLDTGLPALPVVDESGRLAGIVSRGDILRAAVADPPLSLWV